MREKLDQSRHGPLGFWAHGFDFEEDLMSAIMECFDEYRNKGFVHRINRLDRYRRIPAYLRIRILQGHF